MKCMYFSTATKQFYACLDDAISDSRSCNAMSDGEVSDFEIIYRDVDGEDNVLSIDHSR